MREFIKKIQNGNDAAKKRWVIFFSAIAIIIVVFVWLKYFNSIVRPETAEEQARNGNGQGFAFWQTLKAGFGIVFQSIADGLRSVFSAISQPKMYEIKP